MKRILLAFLAIAFIMTGCAKEPEIKVHSAQPTEGVLTPKPAQEVEKTPETLPECSNEPQVTPKPLPVRTPDSIELVTRKPSTINSKPQVTLNDLPELIATDSYKYSKAIKKVMEDGPLNLEVYADDGQLMEKASVYKYDGQYFVVSKERRGFVAEYDYTTRRYKAKELLPNVDVYKAQIYLTSNASVLYSSNSIEVWILGDKKAEFETELARYLGRYKGEGHCLGDAKFHFFYAVNKGRIIYFRFYVYEDIVDLAVSNIKAEYYVEYEERLFYKDESVVYMLDGFKEVIVAVDVKDLRYDKKTGQPIITLNNGDVIHVGKSFLKDPYIF